MAPAKPEELPDFKNSSGLCARVLADMQKLLACGTVQSYNDGVALTQERIQGIKTIASQTASGARCALLLRANSSFKTGGLNKCHVHITLTTTHNKLTTTTTNY